MKTTEQNQTGQAEAPKVIGAFREPPLSLETAKLILTDILLQCEYDEPQIDGLMRLLSGIVAHENLIAAQDYTDWLLRFLYAETRDFVRGMERYISGLPTKSHREDGITIDQIGEALDDQKAAGIMLEVQAFRAQQKTPRQRTAKKAA